MILTLNIDRQDTEVTVVDCTIGETVLTDIFCLNPSLTDTEITDFVKNDLQTKGYIFE